MLVLVLLHWHALTLHVAYFLFSICRRVDTKQMDVPCCIVQCFTAGFPRCFASVMWVCTRRDSGCISLSITDKVPHWKTKQICGKHFITSLPRPTESSSYSFPQTSAAYVAYWPQFSSWFYIFIYFLKIVKTLNYIIWIIYRAKYKVSTLLNIDLTPIPCLQN